MADGSVFEGMFKDGVAIESINEVTPKKVSK